MSRLLDLWATFAQSPLLWLTATLVIYQGAQWLADRTGHAWLNPVLTSIAAVSALLLATGTSYDTYFEGAKFIHFLLGPATVALAVPLYHRVSKLQHLLGPIGVALLVGSLTAIFSAVGLGKLLGASTPTLLSLAPKSVTTAIAMGVSEKLGGLPPLTAVLVILTGIIGAVTSKYILDLLHIRRPQYPGLRHRTGLAWHRYRAGLPDG